MCVCRASRAGRALGLCGWTRPLRPSALPPASTPALPAHWSHPSLSPDTACNFLQSTGRRCGNTGTQCADEFTCPRKRAFNQTCPSSPGDTAQGFLGSSQQDPQPTALRPQERAGLRGPGRQWAPWGSSDPGRWAPAGLLGGAWPWAPRCWGWAALQTAEPTGRLPGRAVSLSLECGCIPGRGHGLAEAPAAGVPADTWTGLCVTAGPQGPGYEPPGQGLRGHQGNHVGFPGPPPRPPPGGGWRALGTCSVLTVLKAGGDLCAPVTCKFISLRGLES